MSEDRQADAPIVIGPEDADASIILLHGLGADGQDLAGLVDHLGLPPDARWRFLFPNAPVRPVTINGGLRMRAWYDIDPAAGPDAGRDDIQRSAAVAAELVDGELARGLDPDRVVLGGFSQGGVIALHQALRHPRALAGVVALSTYLHGGERLAEEAGLANAGASIFMAHGLADPMIPIARAAGSRDALQALGYDVRWHQYPMGHEVCLQELRDLSDWLGERLGR